MATELWRCEDPEGLWRSDKKYDYFENLDDCESHCTKCHPGQSNCCNTPMGQWGCSTTEGYFVTKDETKIIKCPDCGGEGKSNIRRIGSMKVVLPVNSKPRNKCQTCGGEGEVVVFPRKVNKNE